MRETTWEEAEWWNEQYEEKMRRQREDFRRDVEQARKERERKEKEEAEAGETPPAVDPYDDSHIMLPD